MKLPAAPFATPFLLAALGVAPATAQDLDIGSAEAVEVEPEERVVLGSWEGRGLTNLRLADPDDPGSLRATWREEVPVAFSADGRRFARVADVEGGVAVVLGGEDVDDQEPLVFDAIVADHGLRFHPETDALVYVGRRGPAVHVVQGDELGPELEAVSSALLMDGDDVSYAARRIVEGKRAHGVVSEGRFRRADGEVIDLVVGAAGVAYVLAAPEGEDPPTLILPSGERRAYAHSLHTSPDGRIAFVEDVDGRRRFVAGQVSGTVYDRVGAVQWTANGDHFAHLAELSRRNAAENADESAVNGAVAFVVHDGVEYPFTRSLGDLFDHPLLMTDDGARCIYLDLTKTGVRVGVNTGAGQVFDEIHALTVDGDTYSYIGEREGVLRYVVDGNEGPDLEGEIAHIAYADDKSAAAVVVQVGDEQHMMRAGEKIVRFNDIPFETIQFGPEGDRLAFVGQTDDEGTFLIVDNTFAELAETTRPQDVVIPRFTADGEAIHYEQKFEETVGPDNRQRKQLRAFLVVAGERRLSAPQALPSGLMLSPTGEHWAVWTGEPRQEAKRLVLNGQRLQEGWIPVARMGAEQAAGFPGRELLIGHFGEDDTFEFIAVQGGELQRVTIDLDDL